MGNVDIETFVEKKQKKKTTEDLSNTEVFKMYAILYLRCVINLKSRDS